MKRELVWWIAIALMSTLITGTITNFEFGQLYIEKNGLFYTFGSFRGIEILTLIFGIGRYVYLLVDLITDRYKKSVLIISIINAITVLSIILSIYLDVDRITTLIKMYPKIDFSMHFTLPIFFMAVLIVHTAIEIKLIKKLNGTIV